MIFIHYTKNMEGPHRSGSAGPFKKFIHNLEWYGLLVHTMGEKNHPILKSWSEGVSRGTTDKVPVEQAHLATTEINNLGKVMKQNMFNGDRGW